MELSGKKFILCIPVGGINDMTQQLQYCLDYASKTNRKCIVHTRRTREFENDIFDFFDISHERILKIPPTTFYDYVKANLSLTIHPPIITHTIIDSWLPTFTITKDIHGCTLNNVPLYINNKETYDSDILIHNTCGGGPGICWFLKSFPPKEIIRNELRTRYLSLGEKYLAIHIRNTDYKSDISGFLATHDPLIKSYDTVFLASDNTETIDLMIEKYGSKIKTFSTLVPNTVGISQHHKPGKTPQFVIDAFCDFLLLTLAEKYIFSCPQSGYSRNANILFKDESFRDYYKSLLSTPSSVTATATTSVLHM